MGIEWHSDHLEHLGRDWRPEDRADRAAPVAIAGGAHRDAGVDREVEPYVRVKNSECPDHILDGRDLSCIALHELQSRRHVGEEVSYLDRHAWQQGARPLLDLLAGANPDRGTAACAFDIGYGRNAGESLPAEAEARDRGQVG